jgi:holo-[acyl-carrier protein] synthase
MELFLGTDICEINRIQVMYSKYGDRFLKKTFTDDEIKYCLAKSHHTIQRLAVRFSVKEAASKALRVGLNKLGWDKGIYWKDVELIRYPNGNVGLKLSGKASVFEKELGIKNWTVSVSHSKSNAIATVIGYKQD